MKRFSAALLAALTALVLLAAPALAQRDPFDPVIDLTADTGGAATGGGTADGTNSSGDPTTPSNPDAQSDAFPNTGANTTGWLAIAYVLLASGGALLVLSRVDATPAQRTARRVRRL